MSKTKIEWAEHSWNALVGCSNVSPGCKHCYASKQAGRGLHAHWKGITEKIGTKSVWTGRINRAPDSIFYAPLKIKRGQTWFVNSMSDFFHENADPAWLLEMISIMRRCSQHVFLILTKRAEQAEEFFAQHPDAASEWPSNAWVGVSVEDRKRAYRLDILRQLPGRHFVSAEPLLASLGSLDLTGIEWLIGGGESGPGARPCHPEWIRELRDQCLAQEVRFFFKQWGLDTNNPLAEGCPANINIRKYIADVDPHGKGGALLDGRLWHESPDWFRESAADSHPAQPEPVQPVNSAISTIANAENHNMLDLTQEQAALTETLVKIANALRAATPSERQKLMVLQALTLDWLDAAQSTKREGA